VTIDVVAGCNAANATSLGYFASLLYNNVLTGDYQQLQTSENKHVYASAGPLVHIRAIPEGGAAGSVVATALPYTFYDRYASDARTRKADRRQPLPSLFAPRYINGGTGTFNTTLKIWREGLTTGGCFGAGVAARSNSEMPIADAVRFEEHENATVIPPPFLIAVPVQPPPGLPVTSLVSVANTSLLPAFSTSGDVSGWIYLNLDHQGMKGRASQNWVIASMFAEPTYAVEATALALGNGCSPAVRKEAPIAPAPNPNP